MRVLNIFIGIVIASFALSSCESTLESSSSLDNTHMVVYSLFAPDSLWKVYVTETKSIFSEESNLSLEDAEVRITDLTNNFSITFDYSSEGFFYTNHKPIEGHVYYMTVNHEDFGIVKATNSVPSIQSLQVSSSVYANNSESYLNIEITPNSDEEKELYYAWEIVEIDESELDTTLFFSEEEITISNSVQFREFDNDGLSFVGGSDFGDSGSIKDSVQSTLLKQLLPDGQGTLDPSRKVAIKLIAISNDMYHYYNSLSNSSTQVQSSNTNQQEIHSNIIDGYGIFAGYKEKYIVLN